MKEGSQLPSNPSESTRRRNPHLYGSSLSTKSSGQHAATPGTRVRQRGRAPSKLEIEWGRRLEVLYPNYPRPRAQAVAFVLANGVRYTPDWFAVSWPHEQGSRPTAWEVKGRHAWDDSLVKIKVAAHEWPDIQWILCWKEGGEWKEQEILP